MFKLKLSLYVNVAFCLLLLLLLYLHWPFESVCEVPDVRKVELEENGNEMLCNYGSQPIVGTMDTTIYKLRYSYMNTTEFDCCYRHIEDLFGDQRTCFAFEKPTRIVFVKIAVECFYKNHLIYRDHFTFLQNSEMPASSRTFRVSDRKPLSVIVLILSGVSRNRLHTALSETLKYLRRTHQPLEYEYLQPQTENSDENLKKLLINDEGAIWEVYKRAGFLTAAAQDIFKLDEFWAVDFNWNFYSGISKWEIGHYNKFITQCLGARKTYQVIFDYIQSFMEFKKHRILFGTFYLNGFENNRVNLQQTDADFLNFFTNMSPHYSKDTAIFFLSDNIVQEKYQNSTLNSLPFFFLLLPVNFKEEYKIAFRHLNENLKNLVTYEDIFNTLVQFAHLENYRDFTFLMELFKEKKFWNTESFNLLQKGKSRTCGYAKVDPNVCICH